MPESLTGLVAIVTGGASGLGAAIAQRLKEDGATVAVFDLASDAATGTELALRVDVTDDASVVAGVDRQLHRTSQESDWPRRPRFDPARRLHSV